MTTEEKTATYSWRNRFFAIIRQILVLSVLWWIITHGDERSWNMGIIVIGIAVISHALFNPRMPVHLSLINGILLLGLLLWKIVLSGVTMVYHLLSPQLTQTAFWLDYPFHLPADSAAWWLFTQTLNLMPNLLSVQLGQKQVRVHVWGTDETHAVHELYHLEKRIAALFFITIE